MPSSFNPYRVFKFVATSAVVSMSNSVTLFQSLSGFQVRCNAQANLPTARRLHCFNPYRVFKFVATSGHGPIKSKKSLMFQSLSGFQVRCNGSKKATANRQAMFQSLSGFQVRCNSKLLICAAHGGAVSIPIGFSSSLQPLSCTIRNVNAVWFQSLSGFQVRCNAQGDTRWE